MYVFLFYVNMKYFSPPTLHYQSTQNYNYIHFSGFSITPHSDWFLEVGVEYDVSVQLYTYENRKIYITDVSTA